MASKRAKVLHRVVIPLAQIEELAACPHARHTRQQHVEMCRDVDEIEPLAVDDEARRFVVLIEEARVGIGQPRQVFVGNRPLVFGAAHLHAVNQCVDGRLQINDEVGRRRLRFQMAIDLFVQRVLVRRG
jgi:hypothetical protein